mmetsp:Transcript_79679/g.141096  ORF Transcript_79679/g.141096 Transcript_79679/m.141096 type:complete len:222 (-) Transcript_79679:321-986(-)
MAMGSYGCYHGVIHRILCRGCVSFRGCLSTHAWHVHQRKLRARCEAWQPENLWVVLMHLWRYQVHTTQDSTERALLRDNHGSGHMTTSEEWIEPYSGHFLEQSVRHRIHKSIHRNEIVLLSFRRVLTEPLDESRQSQVCFSDASSISEQAHNVRGFHLSRGVGLNCGLQALSRHETDARPVVVENRKNIYRTAIQGSLQGFNFCSMWQLSFIWNLIHQATC